MKLKNYWKTTLWLATIAVLSLMNTNVDTGEVSIPYADKLVHLTMYGILSLVWLFEQSRYRIPNYSLIIILSISYGGLMEILQSFTDTRTADWADVLANALGACAGALALYFGLRFEARKKSSLKTN